jgi:hypothetical protein
MVVSCHNLFFMGMIGHFSFIYIYIVDFDCRFLQILSPTSRGHLSNKQLYSPSRLMVRKRRKIMGRLTLS